MGTRTSLRQSAAGIALVLLAWPVQCDVVVVVSARSPVTALSMDQVADIFLGNTGSFPDGSQAIPVDQPDGAPSRTEFYMKATGKSPQLLKAHWSKLVFTGKGEPPREVRDVDTLKKMIADNPRYIGYIDKSAVDASVKPVLTLR